VSGLCDDVRASCAAIAADARWVRIDADALEHLEPAPPPALDPVRHYLEGTPQDVAVYMLAVDAVNFGSGWFPTLRKLPGRSGYFTIAGGLRDRFDQRGPWAAAELGRIDRGELAGALAQDPEHELIGLFVQSLRDLGAHVRDDHAGSFAAVLDSAGGSAVGLAQRLGGWDSFADTSSYDGFAVPFFKRAQIAAADLARARVAGFGDLHRLTMFADNLVPHVLRLDGVLTFDAELAARIERGELIEHGSPEEVEIRACALHAVELIVAARPGSSAAELDQHLWQRGQLPQYKARPRHRSRCTAY
jgi:hypothetical protein